MESHKATRHWALFVPITACADPVVTVCNCQRERITHRHRIQALNFASASVFQFKSQESQNHEWHTPALLDAETADCDARGRLLFRLDKGESSHGPWWRLAILWSSRAEPRLQSR